MSRLRSICATILLLLGPVIAQAQEDLRPAARTVARLAIHDAMLRAGTVITFEVPDGSGQDGFREGLVEGFLESGLVVVDGTAAGEADVSLSFVPRGPLSGMLKVSVLGRDQKTDRYMLSRAYAVPVVERSFLETLAAPVVVAAGAVLIVYLFLTVRSS